MTFLQENKNMFDILVYVYEHCRQADVCGNPERVAKRLSAAGFEDDDISAALTWLAGIAQAPRRGMAPLPGEAEAFRAYAPREIAKLDVGAKGAVVTFADGGFPDLPGLLGYVERLKGAAKLRPDSKLVISRDWPTGEGRLTGALQISRGLMRVLAAGEPRRELEPA